MRVHVFLCLLASLLAQQFGRLGALFFYKSIPVIRCDHAPSSVWASTLLHVLHIQLAFPILEGLIRCLHDPLLDFGLGSSGNSKPLNTIIPNVILILFWHLTPIIMNDTDDVPSKASASMCCWPLNLFGFHWHPICIDRLHYLNFGLHFVSMSLLLLWLRFGLRGTRGCLGLMLFTVCRCRYRCIFHHATCFLTSAFVCPRSFFDGIIVGA